jgi:hypothetical protein
VAHLLDSIDPANFGRTSYEIKDSSGNIHILWLHLLHFRQVARVWAARRIPVRSIWRPSPLPGSIHSGVIGVSGSCRGGHLPPQIVDRAVALIDYDEVEKLRGYFLVVDDG